MIQLKNICKTYKMGDNLVHALDDVSLHIDSHEFVSIIGPSGSGKSTLMNMIGCLDVPDSGTYLLAGEDVSGFTENQLSTVRNEKIGFVFQQFNLLPKLTAYENVELPMIYQKLKPAERKERVEEAMERVGLLDRMGHKPTELSGGQQQRVAIARALATKPSIILADEPTGNLDSKSGEEVMGIIHELSDQGNTIVLITHDPFVAEQAHRSIKVRDGKVVMPKGGVN
jgi:putative ABC transport system ATP-binding protein